MNKNNHQHSSHEHQHHSHESEKHKGLEKQGENDKHVNQKKHNGHNHGGHDKHAGHSVEGFLKKFIISTILTIPVLALSHMIQNWLGFEFRRVGWAGNDAHDKLFLHFDLDDSTDFERFI